MSNCKNCQEGLVSQGESIKTICPVCSGTGKGEDEVLLPEEPTLPGEDAPVEEVPLVEEIPVAEEVVPVESTPEESFLAPSGEQGEVSSEASNEAPQEEVI